MDNVRSILEISERSDREDAVLAPRALHGLGRRHLEAATAELASLHVNALPVISERLVLPDWSTRRPQPRSDGEFI